MLTPDRGTHPGRLASIGIAAAVIASLAPGSALADGLSSSQVNELESGKVVMVKLDEGGGKGYIGGSSYALMDEDIEKAWNAIQDAKLFPKLYPTTLESKVVSKKDNKFTVKMVQGNAVVKATYYLNYEAEPDVHKLSWKLNKAKPHDIADSRGNIQFDEWKDGRTFMKMSCIVDIGNDVLEKMFGDEIAMGLLRMPMKLRKFLKKSVASKYAAPPPDPAGADAG